jgi:crotonobetainyl-CoA:carnitine CoA-transferase CaiB-like acyl-CoA transferase
MLDSMISAMTSNFVNYLGSGVLPKPLGTAFPSIVPYRTFPTRNREIAVAVASDKLWRIFCEAIGRTDLTDHPDYATNALRVKNRSVLEPLLAAIFLQDTADAWFRKLNRFGVPSSPVRTMEEVVNDPQAALRRMFPVLNHPDAGPFTVTGSPIKMSGTPGSISTPAPLLGEHTREALSELLELGDAELDRLESGGVILSTTPSGRPA